LGHIPKFFPPHKITKNWAETAHFANTMMQNRLKIRFFEEILCFFEKRCRKILSSQSLLPNLQ